MSNFKARLVAPSTANKFYIKDSRGGYNKAMLINSKTGSVLPNCCGQVHGRWLECVDLKDPTKDKLCLGNAKSYWGFNEDGYERGQKPRVGAIACFDGGTYGHVAFVEEVYDNGSILVSNSMYDGSRWYYRTLTPPYDYESITKMKFLGFIYNPYIKEDKLKFKVGDKVEIRGTGNSSSFGNGWKAYGIGWYRKILNVFPERAYPYQVGNEQGTTGFYKEDALRKL